MKKQNSGYIKVYIWLKITLFHIYNRIYMASAVLVLALIKYCVIVKYIVCLFHVTYTVQMYF